MDAWERRAVILAHKQERGCERCGAKIAGRDLQLVRPDGQGLHFSRYMSVKALTDQELWAEAGRRQVVCRKCARKGARYGP